jgi:hypothetical protein
MNENLFNGLEELIVGNEIIVRKLTTEEATQAAESTTVDISDFVEGSETSFTIEQFIQALEYIKNNNRIFTLTTSSPIDTYLDNLAMTNLSLTHDKNSREVVNCSIQAKIIKFTDIGWDIIDSTELAGLTFTSETSDDTDTTLWYDTVQTDGQIRFNDNFSGEVTGQIFGIGVEDQFGLLYKKYIQEYEGSPSDVHEDHADYIEATDVISLTTPGTNTIGFRFWSAYYGSYDETVDSDNNPYWYTVSFPKITVEVSEDNTAEWKPQFAYKGTTSILGRTAPDNQLSLNSAMYNTWYEYEMDVTNSVTEYIDRKAVLAEVRSDNKDYFNANDPEPNGRSNNYQVNNKIYWFSNEYVWARNLADMYSVKVYADVNGGQQLITSVPVSGDFEFFIGRLNVHPEFDADFTGRGKENRTEDVKDAWGFSDPTTKVNVFIAGWMLGGYMKIFAFSRDMLGNQRRIVNIAGA